MNQPTNPHSAGQGPLPPAEGQDSWQEVLGGFPRHLTTELIDEESAQRARREHIGGWVLGLALALFALALPQERLPWNLVGEELAGRSLLHDLWQQLLPRFAEKLGVTSELLALFFSAICYGACLPLALSFGRRLGIAFAPTLLASCLVIFSPAAWLAGTSPGLGSFALLVGLLLMRELWRDGSLRPALVALFWAAGAWVHSGLLLCLEGLLGSIRSRAPGAAANRLTRLLRLAVLLVFGVGAFLALQARELLSGGVGAESWMQSILRAYLPALSGSQSLLDSLGSLPRALLDLPIFLGLVVIGLAALLLLKREEAEEKPPAWLWVWIGLPLLLLFVWSPMHPGDPAVWIWLLPPGLVACLDLIARQDPRPAVLGAALALALQLGVLAGVLQHRTQTDPLADWRASATEAFDPSDWILTADPAHHYLLGQRWGVECRLVLDNDDLEALRDEALANAHAGRRVVLDLEQGQAPAALTAMEAELAGIADLLIFRTLRTR